MADIKNMQTGGQAAGQSPIPNVDYNAVAEQGTSTNNLSSNDLGEMVEAVDPNIMGNGKGVPKPYNALEDAFLKAVKETKSSFLETPVYQNLGQAERYLTDNYGGYNPEDHSVEQWYGMEQPWLKQWANVYPRFMGKVIGSFANGMMDIPNLMNSIDAGDMSKMYDNQVNHWATDLMEAAENAFPNYETNWEKEHPFLNLIPFVGNSPNSWGKVVENVGFTVGSIGSAVLQDMAIGAITGGVGAVPLAAAQINRAVYKIGGLLGKTDDLAAALKSAMNHSDEIAKGLTGIDAFNYGARQGIWGAQMIKSGFAESAFEALESQRTLTSELEQQFFDENTRLPTMEEQDEILRTTRDAGNARFALNAGLLALTNTIQWGSLLRPFNAVKELTEAELKAGVNVALKQGSLDVFEAVKPLSRWGKSAKALSNSSLARILGTSVPEGFEEGAQFAIQKGVDDFYKRQYDGTAIEGVNQFLNSFSYGIGQAIGTQEGLVNIVHGILGGAMYKGGEHLSYKAKGLNTPNYNKQVAAVVEGLNVNTLTGIFENKYGEAVAASAIEQDLINAAENNNPFAYHNYKHQHFANFVLSGIKQNKFETRMDQLDGLKTLKDDAFRKQFGVPFTEQNERIISDYVEVLKENARYIKDVHSKVSRTFINPFKFKGTGVKKDDNQETENENYANYEEAKSQIVYGMSVAKNSKDRISSLSTRITDPAVNKEEIIKLASFEGLDELLKEYSDEHKRLQESFDLTKDAKTKRDLVWLDNRIKDITFILDPQNKNDISKTYASLRKSIFDRYYENAAELTGQKPEPFPLIDLKEYMETATEISKLQRLNRYAIDAYTKLTTRTGFNSLVKKIAAEKEEAIKKEVVLPDPAATTTTTPVDETQKGTQIVTTPAEGSETSTPITDVQKQAAQAMMDIIEGKVKLTQEELENHGFESLANLKMELGNVDMKLFVSVRSSDGNVEMVIPKEIIDNAKAILKTVATPPKPPAPPKPPTGEQPPVTKASGGKNILRLEDYIDKVFVPNDLKDAFHKATFSGNKEDVLADVSITVKPLEGKWKDEYDAWVAAGSKPTPVIGFPNLFVNKSPVDISVSHRGIEIGKLAFPERLVFSVGGKLLPITDITSKTYAALTNRPESLYDADVDMYRSQVAFKNLLAQKFKNNGNQPITISPEELKNLVSIGITYGSLDLIQPGGQRPLFNELDLHTIGLPTASGETFETTAVISLTKTYSDDHTSRIRSEDVNVRFGADFYNRTDIDDSGFLNYIRSPHAIGQLQDVNSRYIGAVQQPNGHIRFVALRSPEHPDKEALFQRIKDRATLSLNTNVEVVDDPKAPFMLHGEHKIHYRLKTQEAKTFNEEFNQNLRTKELYITDKNGEFWIDLSVTPTGALRLEVFKPTVKQYKKSIYIPPQALLTINTFDEFIKSLQKRIEKENVADPLFGQLGVEIDSSNFRKFIPNDHEISGDDLAGQLTAATTKKVFTDGTMRISSKGVAVTEAFKQERGTTSPVTKEEAKPIPEPADSNLPSPFAGIPHVPTTEEGNIPDTSSVNPTVADIERRRNAEKGLLQGVKAATTKEELIQAVEAYAHINPYDGSSVSMGTRAVLMTPGSFERGKELLLEELGFVNKLIDDKYNRELAALQTPTPVPVAQEVVKSEIQNQEDITDIEYDSIEDALKAADLRFVVNPDNTITYFRISTGTVEDQLGLTPLEVVQSLNLKIKKQTGKQRDLDFKLADVAEAENKINIEEAKLQIMEMLPSFISVKDISDILDQVVVDGVAWGAFSGGVIYLNENAAEGTQYHEAFHAVFRMLLNEEEINNYLDRGRDSLYKKLKGEGKNITSLLKEKRDAGLYINLSNKDAYERLYEEHMADMFASWKEEQKPAGFFQKLFSLIRNLFKWLRRDKYDLDMLFRNIHAGKYKHSNISANRFLNEMEDEWISPEVALALVPGRPRVREAGTMKQTIKRSVDSKNSKQIIQSAASYYTLYRNLPEFKKFSTDRLLDVILDDLKNKYNPDNPAYVGMSEEQLDRMRNSDLSYVYDNEESRQVIKDATTEYINALTYIEEFQEEEAEESEQDTGAPSTGYDNRAENVGGFSSLPGFLREYLGFVSYNKIDEFGNAELRAGIPIVATVDAVTVYYGIMRATANITDPIRFFQRMMFYSQGNEQAGHFWKKFVADTGLDEIKLLNEGVLEANKNRQLVEIVRKGFNKFRINYIFTEHDIAKNISSSYPANRKNVENVQFDKWSNSYISEYSEYSEDSQRSIRQNIQTVAGKWFEPLRSFKYSDEQLSEAIGVTQHSLRGIGIQLSRDYIKYSLLADRAAKYDVANEALKKEGKTLAFDDSANTFITKEQYDYVQIMNIPEDQALTPAFFAQLQKLLTSGVSPFFKREIDELTDADTQRGIDTAMTGRLLKVAAGNAAFDESVGESSYTNAEGKVVYAHQDGTFHVKYSYSLRDAEYRKQLREIGVRDLETGYKDAYDIPWLTDNFLLNSPAFEKIANDLIFFRAEGMRPVQTTASGKIITEEFRDQKEGVTYGHYSSREFITTLFNLYVTYSKEQKTKTGTVVTAPHLIRVLEASKTGDLVNLPINVDVYRENKVTDKTKNFLFDEFMKEFNRINHVQSQIQNIKDNVVENYHTGEFADDGFTVKRGYRGLLFSDNIASLLPKDLIARTQTLARNEGVINDPTLISEIKEAMGASLENIVEDTMNMLDREGIVIKVAGNNYNNAFLHSAYRTPNDAINFSNNIKENIGHVVVNDFINTMAYNQILHGDPALSFKNDGGIDQVKRAKGDNAAIISMRTDLIEPSLGITAPFRYSSVAIFKEPISQTDGETKIADAQMYTTVDGLRYTLWGLGRLTPRLARVLDAMQRGDNIHNILDEETGERYDGVFDKDAGILRWDEMTNSIKLVYKDGKSYFKMSVVVLQPSLTSFKRRGKWIARPGWETLHNLRTSIEEKGIQFAAPESASKMMTLDVGRDITGFTDLKGHLFDNQYFGLQTANPSNKLLITTPTQLLQLIDSEQSDDTFVAFQGKTITVRELKKAYQGYVAQKVSNAYFTAKHEVYEIQDFQKDVEESIAKGEVKPRLANFQKSAIDVLEKTGADAQLLDFFSLDENGEPKYNLNLSAVESKFEQLYLSYFSKNILSQKSPGYTVALFSGMDTKALKRATVVKDGVVKAWEVIRRDQFDRNYGGVQDEPYYYSINSATQVGDLFVDRLVHNAEEYDENGEPTGRYFSEMMMPAHDKAMLSLDISSPLPISITDMLGVRIPSQDKHSFIATRLVDFLPANLGSTAMFPEELIKLSGADFDIDKEYLTRYDYYVTKDSKERIVFAKYGDATTDVGKWEEYKRWMGDNNKIVRGIVNDIASKNEAYQKLIRRDDKIDAVQDVIDQLMDLNDKKKKAYRDQFVTSALRQLHLPSNLQEFIEESAKGVELNNGVINNHILDSYIAFLTNDGMRDIANTPASLTALKEIAEYREVKSNSTGGKVFDISGRYPVDSLMGKYNAFKNNTTGKNNIGMDVTANIIYSLLNKAELSLGGKNSGFIFDGHHYNTFRENKEFNPLTGEYDGRRTNDILSTLITSATDEAKEQLNALYNLGVDALKIVDYLVALKVPLKTAIYFVNQPSIKYYLQLKAVKNQTLVTTAEENMFKDDFKDLALEKVKADMDSSLSDDEILARLQRQGLVQVDC